MSFILNSLLVGILLIKMIVALFLPYLLEFGKLARVLNSEKICEYKNNSVIMQVHKRQDR